MFLLTHTFLCSSLIRNLHDFEFIFFSDDMSIYLMACFSQTCIPIQFPPSGHPPPFALPYTIFFFYHFFPSVSLMCLIGIKFSITSLVTTTFFLLLLIYYWVILLFNFSYFFRYTVLFILLLRLI